VGLGDYTAVGKDQLGADVSVGVSLDEPNQRPLESLDPCECPA
jgi:hypothetical protein